jgi:hypothetical protein
MYLEWALLPVVILAMMAIIIAGRHHRRVFAHPTGRASRFPAMFADHNLTRPRDISWSGVNHNALKG